MPLTIWFIPISAIIKFTYKAPVQRRPKAVQAQTQTAQAAEVAESESLNIQVVEAHGSHAGAGRAALPVQYVGQH